MSQLTLTLQDLCVNYYPMTCTAIAIIRVRDLTLLANILVLNLRKQYISSCAGPQTVVKEQLQTASTSEEHSPVVLPSDDLQVPGPNASKSSLLSSFCAFTTRS